MSNRARELEALTDALLDDLMKATDDEILDESIRDGADVESAISFVHTSYNKAKFQIAKDRLTLNHCNTIRPDGGGNLINISDAKKKVIAALIANPEFNNEFTLAARSGSGIPDDDVAGIYNDLIELGLIGKDE